jgi:hypothetical protein
MPKRVLTFKEDFLMGVRKSTGKNKKSKVKSAAVAVKREETLRRGGTSRGRSKER